MSLWLKANVSSKNKKKSMRASKVNFVDTPLPDPSLPDPSLPDPSLPDPSLPDPSLPDPSLPDPSLPDPSLPDSSLPDPSLPLTGGIRDVHGNIITVVDALKRKSIADRSYTPEELQKIVLAFGSKQKFKTFSALKDTDFNKFWEDNNLLAPVDYVKTLDLSVLVDLVLVKGTRHAAARSLGVSDSYLDQLIRFKRVQEGSPLPNRTLKVTYTPDQIAESIVRTGSVALSSFILEIPESKVRAVFNERKMGKHINSEFMGFSGGLGRRAELFWAASEGDNITRDMNVEENTKAHYDFEHKILGRVNVKGSKCYIYKSTVSLNTTKFWKISARSLEHADYCAAVLYDTQFDKPITYFHIPSSEILAVSQTVFKIYLTPKGSPKPYSLEAPSKKGKKFTKTPKPVKSF